MSTNPNFETFVEQNYWEAYIIEKLNELLKDCDIHFEQSTEFENKNRHTDAFMFMNGKQYRIDFKAVDWDSKNNKGYKSNFSLNPECLEVDGYKNPVDYFIFIGENVEYFYIVHRNYIVRNDIQTIIKNKQYCKNNDFWFDISTKTGREYVLFTNEYIQKYAIIKYFKNIETDIDSSIRLF